MSGRESIDFYEKNWSLIVKLFRVDKTYCVNHGFYEKGIRSHVQSVLKMNDLVGDLLKIDFKNHNIKYVLDAGCGIGGTVIHLAKKYPNIKITGITNVKNHIKIAKDNAKQNNVRKNTTFLLKDFIKTGLPSNKFDAIYLIESSSYSQKKRILLQEMYRLLKPGGIIVFIDCFRTNISLNQYLKNFYNLFCKGWAIPNLVELKKFKDYLVLEDFKKITIKDFSKNVDHKCDTCTSATYKKIKFCIC